MQDADTPGYYDQGTEVRLLVALLPLLDIRTVVDVGAERGALVGALLRAGATMVYAFEPFPASVQALQAAYGRLSAVRLFDVAIGAADHDARLYVVEDKTGRLADAYHSMVHFEETPTLRIVGEVPVRCRSLDSLAAEGVLPSRVGILKVDTERNDLAVVRHMGRLSATVVMLEYWDDLPETVGPSPYRVREVADFMAGRGYSNFVTVKRHDQFETLTLNDRQTRPGDWGNLIFLHDTVFPSVASTLLELVARSQTDLMDRARFFADEAQKRLGIVEELSLQVDRVRQRLASADAELRRKEAMIAALTVTADERLRLIESLDSDARRGRRTIETLVKALQQKERVISDLMVTAEERLRLIERLDNEVERSRAVVERVCGARSLHDSPLLASGTPGPV